MGPMGVPWVGLLLSKIWVRWTKGLPVMVCGVRDGGAPMHCVLPDEEEGGQGGS